LNIFLPFAVCVHILRLIREKFRIVSLTETDIFAEAVQSERIIIIILVIIIIIIIIINGCNIESLLQMMIIYIIKSILIKCRNR